MGRIEKAKIDEKVIDVCFVFSSELQLPPTDSDEYNDGSEGEFVVHNLNQKQSHSYLEIYGENSDDEDADYCNDDEAVEEAEEREREE